MDRPAEELSWLLAKVHRVGQGRMTDVTRILDAIERGAPRATEELLPLVYEELRLLAAQKLSHEPAGQTLQATALVHEAYIRLVGDKPQDWNGRGNFFGAAAEVSGKGETDSENDRLASRVGGRTQNLAPLAPSDGKLLVRDQTKMKCVRVAQGL
jgi:hypothetical protein